MKAWCLRREECSRMRRMQGNGVNSWMPTGVKQLQVAGNVFQSRSTSINPTAPEALPDGPNLPHAHHSQEIVIKRKNWKRLIPPPYRAANLWSRLLSLLGCIGHKLDWTARHRKDTQVPRALWTVAPTPSLICGHKQTSRPKGKVVKTRLLAEATLACWHAFIPTTTQTENIATGLESFVLCLTGWQQNFCFCKNRRLAMEMWLGCVDFSCTQACPNPIWCTLSVPFLDNPSAWPVQIYWIRYRGLSCHALRGPSSWSTGWLEFLCSCRARKTTAQRKKTWPPTTPLICKPLTYKAEASEGHKMEVEVVVARRFCSCLGHLRKPWTCKSLHSGASKFSEGNRKEALKKEHLFSSAISYNYPWLILQPFALSVGAASASQARSMAGPPSCGAWTGVTKVMRDDISQVFCEHLCFQQNSSMVTPCQKFYQRPRTSSLLTAIQSMCAYVPAFARKNQRDAYDIQ